MREIPARCNRSKSLLLSLVIVVTVSPLWAQDMRPLSSALAKSIAASGRKTVAVVDFTDLQGNVTELGRFLAEELSVALTGDARNFEVIDRTHLKTILQEHKLATTGLIDPQTARKLGQIAGVDTLVTGNITPFGDSVRLSAKVLDTSTARIIGAASTDVPKTKAIEKLLGHGIGTVSQTSGAGATPVQSGTAVASQKEDDFAFELKSCQRSGMTVVCRLSITNEGEDRQLSLVASGMLHYGKPISSRMFDQAGNEYQAQKIRVGNKESESRVEALLVSGVPTSATLTFEKVSADANRVALLEIGCYRQKVIGSGRGFGRSYDEKVFTVQMRNIPLGR